MRHFHRGTKLNLPERRSQVWRAWDEILQKTKSKTVARHSKKSTGTCVSPSLVRIKAFYDTDWFNMIHRASAVALSAWPLGVSVSRAFRSKSLSDSTRHRRCRHLWRWEPVVLSPGVETQELNYVLSSKSQSCPVVRTFLRLQRNKAPGICVRI